MIKYGTPEEVKVTKTKVKVSERPKKPCCYETFRWMSPGDVVDCDCGNKLALELRPEQQG